MKLFNTFVLTAIACVCVATASDDVLPKHNTVVVKKVHLVDEMKDSTSGSESSSGSGSEASTSGSGSEEEWSSSDSFVSSSSTSGSEGSDNTDSMSDILDDDIEVVKVVKVKKGKQNVKALPVDKTPLPTHTMQSSTPPAVTMETIPRLPLKTTPHPVKTTVAPISHMEPEIGSAEADTDSESTSASGEDSASSSGDIESDSGSDVFDEVDSFLGSNLDDLDDEISSMFGSTSDSDSMDDEITFPVDPFEIDVKNEMKNEGADALTMAVAVGCIVGFIAIIVVAIIAVKKNAMYSSSILGAMATETNAHSTEKAIDGSDEEASTEDALEKGEGAPLTSRSVTNGDAVETEGKFE